MTRQSPQFTAEYPLLFASAGEQVRICRIPTESDLAAKLLARGFLPGEKVKIVSDRRQGTIIVEARESRFALDAGTAMHVMVD